MNTSSPIETGTQRPSRHPWRAAALTLVAAAALAACGGGDGSSTQQTATGVLSVRVTDGPDTSASHVWVTLTKVAVNASDVAQMQDSGWVTATLPAPVTVDMNTLSNGALSDVLASLTLPVGTYKQIRLLLAASDDALTNSAVNAGLVYNDQVNYIDANGMAQVAPLEIAQAKQGISLQGTFKVTADTPLNLAIEFDVGNDVVPFRSGNSDAFTLIPDLKYFDLGQSGAATGRVDMSACSALAVNPCQNLVVKAETLSSDGTYHAIKRWTNVEADGSYTLFPLPVDKGQVYDIIVRGDNAQSMMVRNVPVTAGSTPTSGATVVSSSPLAVQSASPFALNWASGVQPTGVTSRFYQTLTGASSIPYEFASQRVDPFTGTFLTDMTLSGGDDLVGDYVANGNPVMVATTPSEGSGAYTVIVTGHDLARTTAGTVAASGDGSTSMMTPPVMAVGSGVAGFGTISGTIDQLAAGKYDRGYLVVTQGGDITNAIDISQTLQLNGGAGGGYSIGYLPAGSGDMPIGRNGNGKGIYYAYLRVWNSTAPDAVTIVPVDGSADLDDTNAATLNVSVQ